MAYLAAVVGTLAVSVVLAVLVWRLVILRRFEVIRISEARRQRHRLSTLEEEYRTQGEAFHDACATAAHGEEVITDLRRLLVDLTLQLDEATDQRDSIQTELRDAQEEIDALRATIAKLREREAQLDGAVADATTLIEAIAELRALGQLEPATIAEDADLMPALRRSHSRLQQALARTTAQLASSQAELQSLRTRLAQRDSGGWRARSWPAAGAPAAFAAGPGPRAPRQASAAGPGPSAPRRPASPLPTVELALGDGEILSVTAPVEPSSGRMGDELLRISGLSRAMAEALHAAGLSTLERIAETDDATLRAALRAKGLHFAPTLSTWRQQAAALRASGVR